MLVWLKEGEGRRGLNMFRSGWVHDRDGLLSCKVQMLYLEQQS